MLLGALVPCACAPEGAKPPLAAAELKELETLANQLAEPGRSTKTRFEATELLLNREHPRAVRILQNLLGDSNNRPAQLAIAETIARRGEGPGELVGPLGILLTGDEPSVRQAAGRALATYKDDIVRDMLIEAAGEQQQDREVRLIAIRALHRMPDKRVVKAMVALLDDADKDIRDAAGETLGKLTRIRAFGLDPETWKRWWTRNKQKDRSEWLADLAESLTTTNAELEIFNTQLRERLVLAITELYAATPPAQRDAVLLGFLQDPVVEVRLAGAKLVDQRLAGSEGITDDIARQTQTMLSDRDARCRRTAALLLTSLSGHDSLDALLDRLEIEQDDSVREGLLTAIGHSRDPIVLPSVLAEIPSSDPRTSAAAAFALGRIAETHPLNETTKANTVKVLIDRYAVAARSPDDANLHEALITAMGKVGDKGFVEVLLGALDDKAATVRLAAVNALEKVGDSKSAVRLRSLVESDVDRGVRGAAIAALGTLGGKEHLESILKRTDPSMEPDAAVRQKAWTVVMDVLGKADAETLRAVAKGLADRPDATDELIRILQMLVDALNGEGSKTEAEGRRQLGMLLLKAGRPAEAGPHLERAWAIYQKNGDPVATEVWSEWINVLLSADDPTAIRAMNEQLDDEHFARALRQLNERLMKLARKGKYAPVILLTQAALKELPHRLTADQREIIQKLFSESLVRQKYEDRRTVAGLVAQLNSTDEGTRKTAITQIKAMGRRATVPLILELKAFVLTENSNSQKEIAILGAMGEVAPELNDYNPEATKDQKLKLIDVWLGKYR
ncbi:MAG: HEAT repeat domain-containing protein, partial [Planctomycetota bacterium]|jgi:HEAT repeat protein